MLCYSYPLIHYFNTIIQVLLHENVIMIIKTITSAWENSTQTKCCIFWDFVLFWNMNFLTYMNFHTIIVYFPWSACVCVCVRASWDRIRKDDWDVCARNWIKFRSRNVTWSKTMLTWKFELRILYKYFFFTKHQKYNFLISRIFRLISKNLPNNSNWEFSWKTTKIILFNDKC